MGASNEKYASAGGSSGLSSMMGLGGVRYEPDIMTVRERLLDELEWTTFITDKYGFQSFKRLLASKGEMVVLDFWKIAWGYRKQYDAIPTDELKVILHDPVLKCLEDPFTTRLIGKTNTERLKGVMDPDSEERLSLQLFDSALRRMGDHLANHEFFDWKNSEAPDAFFQHTYKLQDILEDHHALFYFEKSLANEYSSENINFLDTTREYENKWAKDKAERNWKMANKILHMFITQESPSQVNIPSTMRVQIEKKVMNKEHLDKGLFQMAQRETVLLMSRDGWPRYRRSLIFGQYLRSRRPVTKGEQKPLGISQSYKVRKMNFHSYIGSDSMDDVLDSMMGRDCFDKYLRVHDSQNGTINFVGDVLHYRKLTNSEQMQKKAKAIYATYFDPSTAKEHVDVSKSIANSLSRNINNPDATTFDPAVQSIRSFLKSKKIFEGFKETGLYTKYRLMVRTGHSSSSVG